MSVTITSEHAVVDEAVAYVCMYRFIISSEWSPGVRSVRCSSRHHRWVRSQMMFWLSTLSKMSFKQEAVKYFCRMSCRPEQSRSYASLWMERHKGLPVRLIDSRTVSNLKNNHHAYSVRLLIHNSIYVLTNTVNMFGSRACRAKVRERQVFFFGGGHCSSPVAMCLVNWLNVLITWPSLYRDLLIYIQPSLR